MTSSDAPADTIGVLFFGWAMFAAVDWLYSKIPVRFPELRICLSEGGIGWVAGLLDRLDHVGRYQQMYGTWEGIDLTPREVMQRNFWFCAIDDPAGARAAPPHRRRPRAARDRLPPPGRHVARHPGAAPPADRALPRRRHPQAHVGERVAAVRPSGAATPCRPTPTRTDRRKRMDTTDIRFRIAAARRILYREGCDTQHRRPRQRPRRRRGRVLGHRPRVLRPDHARPGVPARLRPPVPRTARWTSRPRSTSTPRIYERRPDVEAIVHLHSHYVSVLSSTGRTIGMYNVGSVLFHDDQATYFDDGDEVRTSTWSTRSATSGWC